MDHSTFDILYDKACESAILESYRRIQIPDASVIQASWEAVRQRMQQEKTSKYVDCEEENNQ